MNPRHSVLGEIVTLSGRTVTNVNVGALVRRLLLFDTVVVKSFRLREFPVLIRAFGKDGFRQLLGSGFLKFNCEFTVLAGDFARNGVRSVPLEHFHFGIVDAFNREHDLRRELAALQSISGLKNEDRAALEEEIWISLVRPPSSFGKDLLAQVENDLRVNTPALRVAISQQLTEQHPTFRESELQVQVEETTSRVFRVKNNIADMVGLPKAKAHDVVQKAVFAVTNLGHRLLRNAGVLRHHGLFRTRSVAFVWKAGGNNCPAQSEDGRNPICTGN